MKIYKKDEQVDVHNTFVDFINDDSEVVDILDNEEYVNELIGAGDAINNIPDNFVNDIPNNFVNNIPNNFVNNIPNNFVNNIPNNFVNDISDDFINDISNDLMNNIPNNFVNDNIEVFPNDEEDYLDYIDNDYVIVNDPTEFYYEGEKIALKKGDKIKIIKEEGNKVIKIQEEVRILQDGFNLVLEEGDKIEVLTEAPKANYNPKYASNPTQRLKVSKNILRAFDVVMDFLHNSMEYADEREFISHVVSETNVFSTGALKKIWKAFLSDDEEVMSNMFRFDIEDDIWLSKFL